METNNRKHIIKSITNLLPIAISIAALLVSISTCSKSDKANRIAEKAQQSDQLFSEINAELVWNNLINSYYETDNMLMVWEKGLIKFWYS